MAHIVSVPDQFTTLDEVDMAHLKESTGNDRLDSIEKLSIALSTPSCVNGSFMSKQTDQDSSFASDFDFKKAETFFDSLRDLPEQGSIVNAVKNVVAKLPTQPQHDILSRLYIILPLCHVLAMEELILDVTFHFTLSLMRMKESLDITLEKWLQSIDKPFFLRIVKLYRNCLQHLVKSTGTDGPTEDYKNSLVHLVNSPGADDSNKVYRNGLIHLLKLPGNGLNKDYRDRLTQVLNSQDIGCLNEFCRNGFTDLVTSPGFHGNNEVFADGLSHLVHTPAAGGLNKVTMKQKKRFSLFILMMSKLHNANRSRSKSVNYRNFQVPDFMRLVHIQLDYLAWVTSKNEKHFFYSKNLFLYDVKSKDVALKYQNRLKMSKSKDELILRVSRDQLIEDTKEQLKGKTKEELSLLLHVICHSDSRYGSGATKNYFQDVFSKLLDKSYGLVSAEKPWFDEKAMEDPSKLEDFHLLGKLCALAIYNSVEIPLYFPTTFYKKMLKIPVTLKDLEHVDPTIARSLQQILMDENIRDSFLDFKKKIVTPDGTKTECIEVTKENREEFVDWKVDQILNKSVQKPFEEFMKGFNCIPLGRIWKSFYPEELKMLITGSDDYDFEVFEKNTEYIDEFKRDHQTICHFWKVFHAFSFEEKKRFLCFLRGSAQIPLTGMKGIQMKIKPLKTDRDREQNLMPEVFTCFDELSLPRYTSADNLKERFLEAFRVKGFNRL